MKSKAELQQKKFRAMEKMIQDLNNTIHNMTMAEKRQNKTVNELKEELASKVQDISMKDNDLKERQWKRRLKVSMTP